MRYSQVLKKIQKSQKGFTLLEVLIAITILIFAITATFTAAQSGLSSSAESKNQVIAFYMAQEAVEYIRNTRDTNALLSQSWLLGIADPSTPSDPCYSNVIGTPGKTCAVDMLATTKLFSCPTGTGSCPAITQDTASSDATYGMYSTQTGGGWTSTNFKREIQITVISNDEASIAVTVSWLQGSYSRNFVVHESIFNWQS